MLLASCSLSVRQMVLIKYASNTLRFPKFSGALLMMVHENLWVGFSFKCLAGSDLLFCLCVHSIVFQHYEQCLQYNFGHKNNPEKWHNYNLQPYPLMETVTAISLCSKQNWTCIFHCLSNLLINVFTKL